MTTADSKCDKTVIEYMWRGWVLVFLLVKSRHNKSNACMKTSNITAELSCALLTKDLAVEYELPSQQADDNGQYPTNHFQDVPPEARVLVKQEGEAVTHHNHTGLRLTVWDGVFGEDEEIEEGDEVSHDEPWPRVLEVIAKAGIYFHPAEPPQHTWECEKVLLSVRLHNEHGGLEIRSENPSD